MAEVTWQKLKRMKVPMDQWPENIRLEFRVFTGGLRRSNGNWPAPTRIPRNYVDK